MHLRHWDRRQGSSSPLISLELEVAKVTPQEEAAVAILKGTLFIRQICASWRNPMLFSLSTLFFERVSRIFKYKRQLGGKSNFPGQGYIFSAY